MSQSPDSPKEDAEENDDDLDKVDYESSSEDDSDDDDVKPDEGTVRGGTASQSEDDQPESLTQPEMNLQLVTATPVLQVNKKSKSF